MMNRALTRIAIRQYRKNGLLKGKLFRRVMDDDDIVDAVVAHAVVQSNEADWESFLQWLIANGPAIIAFIMTLLAVLDDQ